MVPLEMTLIDNRRTRTLILVGALTIGSGTAGCGGDAGTPARAGTTIPADTAASAGEPAAPDSAPPRLVRIEVGDDMRFSPASVSVRMGDTVEWVVTGSIPHTVTDAPGTAAVREHTVLPPGAAPWHSGLLDTGARYQQVLHVRGTYAYLCVIHEANSMLGALVVR